MTEPQPEPDATPAGAASAETARAALVAMREIMEGIEDRVPALADRLTSVPTSVAVHLGDAPDLVATVRLDRRPIVVNDGADADARVHLWAEPRHVLMSMSGERQLAMLIVRGEVAYEGPVREILRVMPIIRHETRAWRERQEQSGMDDA